MQRRRFTGCERAPETAPRTTTRRGRRLARGWLGGVVTAACLLACGTYPNSGSEATPFAQFDAGSVDASSGPSPFHDASSSDAPLGIVLPGTPADSGSTPPATLVLAVAPATATLTITNVAAPPSQTFTATVVQGGSSKPVTPVWSLADFTIGTINAAGKFTPNGAIAGNVTVLATYGSVSAQATLQVTTDASSQLGDTTLPDGTTISQDAGAIAAGNLGALGGAPQGPPDGGTFSHLLYPYDHTVFPRGLLAPVIQFTSATIVPQDFKITLDTTSFHWDGYGHVGDPAALLAAIPQVIWDGALESAQPDPATKKATVTLSLVTATNSIAYGPSQAQLTIAPGKLTGVIYYESYGSDPVALDAGSNNNGTDFGLWAVKPGTRSPPANIQSGCVICHGVSASGNTITAGTDDPTIGFETGVFRIETDGGYTQLATAPSDEPYPIANGIDSRGLGWGVVSPDGKTVLRSKNQFWGGQMLDAWQVPDAPLVDADGGIQPLSTEMTVSGNFNMFVPSFSVDGEHLVYINAANAAGSGSAGAASQSVAIVDTAIVYADGGTLGFGSVTLSSPRTIYDSTADAGGGAYTKAPNFLPDSETVVFEETVANYADYDHMLPDYGGVDGRLYALQPSGSGGAYVHTELANANLGFDPNAQTHNYEPKSLPVEVGGYYWVVFASTRTDAYPSDPSPKKLWVTAISTGVAPGTDPSNPPFTLINQSIVPLQPSQRGYWALSPCQPTGASCATGDDCCDGSCRPESNSDPSSPLVCQLPPTTTCVAVGNRCRAGHPEDCCNAAAGTQCIGTLNGYGKCELPAPPPTPAPQ